jgi:hypothetical protein
MPDDGDDVAHNNHPVPSDDHNRAGTRRRRIELAIAGIGLLAGVAAVTGFSLRDIGDLFSGDSRPATTSPTTPQTTISPSTASTATPTSSPSEAAPTTSSEQPDHQLELADHVFVDLDDAIVGAESGQQFEFFLSYARFFHGPRAGPGSDNWGTFTSKFAIISDSKGRSANVCKRATHVIPGILFYSQVKPDESVCVSTSKGRWAIMKLTRFEGNQFDYRELDFDVWLY